MAKIIDKDTRLIDIDFGPVEIVVNRPIGDFVPNSRTESQNGINQLLNIIDIANPGTGSFIQYERLDLDFMVRNNEVMMPVDVAIQRTSPVPLGYNNNGNNFDQIEEYVYILSRPLNNTHIGTGGPITNVDQMNDFRSIGLDRAQGDGDISGNAGWPTLAQCIFAEKRMYSYNDSLMATANNGELNPGNLDYNSLAGMPSLDSVTTWGSLAAITGPTLHCYRIVLNRNQSFPAITDLTNVNFLGSSQCVWPPVSVRFLCKDPGFTEGEYITRLANAMNNIAEGGPTA